MKTVIVGAGVIGALIGWRLARAGAEVTVVEAGQPAGAATGASFGWINASFYADADHFQLRHAAMEAHRRLTDDLPTRATSWSGCLCWEETGAAFDARYEDLKALGYAVEVVDRDRFARLEPAIAPPERAMHFPDEGATELAALTRDALRVGMDAGLRLVCGVQVQSILHDGGAVRGVETMVGPIEADRVVLATGTGSTGLLEQVDVPLPMLHRPGLILRSVPLPPLLRHVLVAPAQEFRQDAEGCLLAPTDAAHQQIANEAVVDNPVALADAAAARLGRMLDRPVRWAQVTSAARPVPRDGLPVIGHCGPEGLYITTMHSGATLAPLVAEIAASEIQGQEIGNARTALVSPYRPDRFRD